MDALQATTAATSQAEDLQVTYTLDSHVAIAIAFLVVAILVVFFVALISTYGKENDGPKA